MLDFTWRINNVSLARFLIALNVLIPLPAQSALREKLLKRASVKSAKLALMRKMENVSLVEMLSDV
jgi:hypothetical protein